MGRVEWPCQSIDSPANTVLDLSTFVRLRFDQTLQLSILGLDLEPGIEQYGPSILAYYRPLEPELCRIAEIIRMAWVKQLARAASVACQKHGRVVLTDRCVSPPCPA